MLHLYRVFSSEPTAHDGRVGRISVYTKYFETLNDIVPQNLKHDWNIETASERANEHIATFGARWNNKQIGAVEYNAEAG